MWRMLLVFSSGKVSTGQVWAQSSAPSKHETKSSFSNLNDAALYLLLVGSRGRWAEKIKPCMVMHIHVLLCNSLMLPLWYAVTHLRNIIYYTSIRRCGWCVVFSHSDWTHRHRSFRRGTYGGDFGVDSAYTKGHDLGSWPVNFLLKP